MPTTRRRPGLAVDDDPRKPRKFRQKSGVNLIHEEPWYGFNVAYKMPVRDDEDPSGNPFLGFSRLIIAFQELTKDEFGTNQVDSRVLKTTGDATSGERAVTNEALNSSVVSRRVVENNAIGTDEADADFLDAKHFIGTGPARLPTGVKVRGATDIDGEVDPVNLPNLAGLNGDLPGSRISGNIDVSNLPLNIPANNVPNIQSLNGTLPIGQTSGSLGAGRVPNIGNLNGTLSYKALSNKPNLGKFLTSKDIQNRATHAWVRAYVTKHVKPTARR